MGTTDRGQYLPALGESGWSALVNANFSRTADLAINVKAFGATGNGIADDTAAVQAAINTLSAAGDRLLFPAGTYLINSGPLTGLVTGTKITGEGRNATKLNISSGSADMWSLVAGINKITFESLTLSSYSGGGHIFAPAGSVNTANFLDIVCVQNNPAKSIWKQGDFGYLDNLWLGCVLTHNGATSVPAFDFTAATDSRYNSNTWMRCQCNHESAGASYFFDFATSAAAEFNYDNTFRDLTFEVCNGGCIRVLTSNGALIENVGVYDLTTTTADLFKVGAGTGSLTSRQTTFRGVKRRGGTLGGGLFDIALQSGGKAIYTTFQECNLGTLGTGFAVDLQSNAGAIAVSCDQVSFSNKPASFVEIGRRGLVSAEGITTKVKAGTPGDGDFTVTPADGTFAVDSTANKIWVRVGGTWKYAALT